MIGARVAVYEYLSQLINIFFISFAIFCNFIIILFHLFLDYLLGGGGWEGIMWFWPLSASTYKIQLLAKMGLSNIPAALDALILLVWLAHEEIRHKIITL